VRRLRRLVRQASDQVAARQRELERAAGRQVVALATAMAERIVRRELETHPDTVRALVAAALEEVDQRGQVRVRVHPEMAALFDDDRPPAGGPGLTAEIVPDPSLEPGDCVIEAEMELIDARIATQLAQLREAAERAL
jgi:flagellar assembly protein FliH